MRILIVNKFMYPRGGDCIVALNTARLLREHGHEVRLFAMDYPDNLDVPDAAGYAPEVRFDGSASEKLKAFRRLMGKGPVRKAFGRVMDEFRPDVVHLHNIHSYLSPVVGEIAARKGVRVVWTLHDYKLLCPSYNCLRPDGTVCEECFGGNLKVSHFRCMKGGRAASFIARLEGSKWHKFRLENFTSKFICPSRFMAECMKKGEYAPEKLEVLCNFADPEKYEGREVVENPDGYFCYAGRLSREKGVTTLVEAAHKAHVRLTLAGDGPLKAELEERYKDNPMIKFTGYMNAGDVAILMSHAKASVLPSEWYENNPLGVIESLSLGVPAIGARIGGIPELLEPLGGVATGETFTSGDLDELTAKLRDFDASAYDRKAISAAARSEFSPEKHYEKLLEIYQGSK